MDACMVEGCGRGRRTRGLCSAHYHRLMKHGDVNVTMPRGRPRSDPSPCSAEGCDKPARGRGLCEGHYRSAMANGGLNEVHFYDARTKMKAGPCAVEGCDRTKVAFDLCHTHYGRRRAGMAEKHIHTTDSLRGGRNAPARKRRFLDECAGMTRKEAARHMGLSYETVRNYARANPGFLKAEKSEYHLSRRAATMEFMDRANALRVRGYTKTQVARELGVPSRYVVQTFIRNAPELEWRDGRRKREGTSAE